MSLCSVYQWLIRFGAEASDAVRSPHLHRHLKKCAACRRDYRDLMQLEDRLRTSPAETLSATQHARIENSVLARLEQVNRSAQNAVPTMQRHRLLWAAGAVVAAAVFMLVSDVYISLHRRQLETQPESITLTALLADSQQLTRQIPQWAFLPEQSMQTEIQRLTNDTRQTVAFLLNCTPSHPGPDLDNGL